MKFQLEYTAEQLLKLKVEAMTMINLYLTAGIIALPIVGLYQLYQLILG